MIINRIFFSFLLVTGSISVFAQQDQIELKLTDSAVYLNQMPIPGSVDITYFTGKLGNPDRNKTNKDITTSIYDKLGIVITTNKKTKKVNAINFYFTNMLKEYPKTSFTGTLLVNGIAITKDDTPETIHVKLPGFSYENILSLSIFEQGKIEFYTSGLPGGQMTSFGYNFFRSK